MSERSLRAAVAALALAGAGIAAYVVYARYAGEPLACTTGGCESVQRSAYAVAAGVPVSVLGLACYVAILALALAPGDAARAAVVALALGGLVFSGYLVVVQLAVLRALCQWCIASDVVMTAIAGVALVRFGLAGRVASAGRRASATP